MAEVGTLIWAVIGIAALAVSAALVPALVELRRAARSLDRALEDAREKVPPMLDHADALLAEATRLLGDARGGLDRVGRAATDLGRDAVTPVAWLAGALAGVREGVEVLLGNQSGASRAGRHGRVRRGPGPP